MPNAKCRRYIFFFFFLIYSYIFSREHHLSVSIFLLSILLYIYLCMYVCIHMTICNMVKVIDSVLNIHMCFIYFLPHRCCWDTFNLYMLHILFVGFSACIKNIHTCHKRLYVYVYLYVEIICIWVCRNFFTWLYSEKRGEKKLNKLYTWMKKMEKVGRRFFFSLSVKKNFFTWYI